MNVRLLTSAEVNYLLVHILCIKAEQKKFTHAWGKLLSTELDAEVEVTQALRREAPRQLVSVGKRISIQVLHQLFVECVSHRGALQAQGRPKCPVKAGRLPKLVAEVFGNGSAADTIVSRHLGSPDEVFVEGLTFNQRPKAVFLGDWVDHLAGADLAYKVIH